MFVESWTFCNKKTFQLLSFKITKPAGSSTSPRLSSTGATAILTIIDDEGGAGLFRLSPTQDTVEESSQRISFSVLREGGSQGRVSVLVNTVEGNTETTGRISQNFSPVYMYLKVEHKWILGNSQ